MNDGPRQTYQFRLVHLLVLTALAAAWLALFRLGGGIQIVLVVCTAVVSGPVIAAVGRATFRPWVELVGNMLTIVSPLTMLGSMWLLWKIGAFG